MSKNDVRRLSRRLGLPTWDKPAYACLASRIPYHRKITAEKLHQVEKGEEFLRSLGVSPQLRVRHYGDMARLELAPADIATVAATERRTKVLAVFRKLGFSHIALDLEGYTMGSLNRSLNLLEEKNAYGQSEPEESAHPGS
jgi:uncharacterized protein